MVKEEEKKSKDKKNWPYWMLEGKNACIPVLHNRSVHHYCKDRQLGLIRAKATCEGRPAPRSNARQRRGRSLGLTRTAPGRVAWHCVAAGGEFRIGI